MDQEEKNNVWSLIYSAIQCTENTLYPPAGTNPADWQIMERMLKNQLAIMKALQCLKDS